MNRMWILAVGMILVLSFGCTTETETTQYVCPGGLVVSDPADCFVEEEVPYVSEVEPKPQDEVEEETPETSPELEPVIFCLKEGGNDKFSQGIATITKDGETIEEKEDVCLDGTQLKEYYCEATDIESTVYECSEGCDSGKCNPELLFVECMDTDGGMEFAVKGEIIYIYHYSDDSTTEDPRAEDYCVGGTLNEWICSDVSESDFCEESAQFGWVCTGDIHQGNIHRKVTSGCTRCEEGACK